MPRIDWQSVVARAADVVNSYDTREREAADAEQLGRLGKDWDRVNEWLAANPA